MGRTITFDLTVPNDPAMTDYDLSSPCGNANIAPQTLAAGSNNLPVSVTLGDCGSATDVMISASNPNNPPLETIYAPNLALANGVAVTLPGLYVPVTQASLAYTDIDADTSTLVLRRRMFATHGEVFALPQAACSRRSPAARRRRRMTSRRRRRSPAPRRSW